MRATHRSAETRNEPRAERADLTAWRRRHELRRSNAAQPVPSKRRYERTPKHRHRTD
ncbi:hypothetical protein [Nocardia blacklockiae]|uniref:hypothetical protein n=1 Tax=Nocardia blacklockiae TaxID=480036 RepID=UPI001894988B|nr:hypothetical protein [Nocardia blacklockiae]MBF6174236.1 hypothetical protein [Nocardia blacklockiae]